MKFSLYIDQIHSVEWGLNLSEAALFDFLYKVPSWAKFIIINNELFYFAARQKAVEEVPIISDKPDTIYRLYKSLSKKGLIKYVKKNKCDYIQITTKGKCWNNSENFPKTENNSEKNPEKLGKKSENNSENSPTYKNTNTNKNTTNTSLSDSGNPTSFLDKIKKGDMKSLLPEHQEIIPKDFDWFWKRYNHGARSIKHISKSKYEKQTLSDLIMIAVTLPYYLADSIGCNDQEDPENFKPQRKSCQVYLNQKPWRTQYEELSKLKSEGKLKLPGKDKEKEPYRLQKWNMSMGA